MAERCVASCVVRWLARCVSLVGVVLAIAITGAGCTKAGAVAAEGGSAATPLAGWGATYTVAVPGAG
ncbi:MAG: hypothetical protein EXS13_09215 [Planctomycetes bacterium]|nr:hypothetical protein [Planctomycetota bacterium]